MKLFGIFLLAVGANAVCQKQTCGKACVDISQDQHNCGQCGNACPPGSHCSDGKCICQSAKKNKVICGGKCVPECPEGQIFNEQCQCTIAPCSIPGNSPLWSNIVRPGGGLQIVPANNAQDCCTTCLNDPNCAQWAIIAGQCQHNVGTTCVGPPISIGAGGNRCPGTAAGIMATGAAASEGTFASGL